MKAYFIALVATSLAPLILVVWREVYPIHCISLLLPLFISIILTISLREKAVKRRECLAHCYFQETSFLYRILRSKMVVTFIAFVVALALCLALVTDAISWHRDMLILLGIDTLIVCLLYLYLVRASSFLGIKQGMHRVIAKNWAVAINIPILLISSLLMQYHSPVPEYISCKECITHTGAMRNASHQVGSECYWVNIVTKLHAEKDALAWWLMVTASKEISNKSFRWAAWILFLVSGSLSAWGYSRLCVQLADFSYSEDG